MFRNRRLGLDQALAALLSVVGLGVSLLWGLRGDIRIYLSLSVGIPSLLYLFMRKRWLSDERFLSVTVPADFLKFNHISFALVFLLSLFLVMQSSPDYSRPASYFFFVLAAAASILVDIFCLQEASRSHAAIALAKIIFLGASLYASSFFLFPYARGPDAWTHNQWIQETLPLGHFTAGTIVPYTYAHWPVFDTVIEAGSLVTGLSIPTSFFVFIDIPLVIITGLVTFKLGEKLANAKVGLLAALLLVLSDRVVNQAVEIIPMTVGFCFVLLSVYTVVSGGFKGHYVTLLIVFLGALVMTHTIASFIMLSALIGFIAVFWMRIRAIDGTAVRRGSGLFLVNLCLLFSVEMLFWWGWGNPDGLSSFFDTSVENLLLAVRGETSASVGTPSLGVTTVPNYITLYN